MIKRLKISLIVAAILTAVFVSVMPHHHHGSLLCIAFELCDEDGAVNDAHTRHHQTDNDELCFVRQIAGAYVEAHDAVDALSPCKGFPPAGLPGSDSRVVCIHTSTNIAKPCSHDAALPFAEQHVPSLRAPPAA